LLLLPFTLLNLAGWMHWPFRQSNRIATAHRAIVSALGISLTISSVAWLSILFVDRLAIEWGAQLGDWLPSWLDWIGARSVRLGLGLFLVIAAILAACRYADPTESRLWNRYPRWTTTDLTDQSVQLSGTLADPHIWGEYGSAHRLLAKNRFAALVTWIAVASAGITAIAAPGSVSLGIGNVLILIGLVQIAMLVILLLLDLLSVLTYSRRHERRDLWPRTSDGFRFLGPTVMATLAVAMSNGGFAALIQLLDRLIGGGQLGPAPEHAFLDVLGVTALLWAVSLIAIVVLHRPLLLSRATSRDSLQRRSEVRAAKVARARRLANLPRNLDLAGTIPAAGFLLLLTWAGMRRVEAGGPGLLGWLAFQLEEHKDGIPFVSPSGEAALRNLMSWLLPLSIVCGMLLTQVARKHPGGRRLVGLIWDTLTFWPRRFQPFAVRSSGLPAVKQLQERIAFHLEERGGPLIVTAHGHGSVLAVAAILPKPDLASRVALVTMGTPLKQLYARFFPAYLGVDGQFEALRKRLAASSPIPRDLAWTNYYRLSDYVGRQIFGAGDPADRLLNDSVLMRSTSGPRQKTLLRHSGYFEDPKVRDLVRTLRAKMTSPLQGRAALRHAQWQAYHRPGQRLPAGEGAIIARTVRDLSASRRPLEPIEADFLEVSLMLDALEAAALFGELDGAPELDALKFDTDSWWEAHRDQPQEALVLMLRFAALRRRVSIERTAVASSSTREFLRPDEILNREIETRLVAGSGSSSENPTASKGGIPLELIERVGLRRAAEIALEEGELLALRFPRRAAVLLRRAEGWFENCEDYSGAVIAGGCAALVHARTGQTEELKADLEAIKPHYKRLATTPGVAIPSWSELQQLAEQPRLDPLDDLEPAKWSPWAVRLTSCLAFRRDQVDPLPKPRISMLASWAKQAWGVTTGTRTVIPVELQGLLREEDRSRKPAAAAVAWARMATTPTTSVVQGRFLPIALLLAAPFVLAGLERLIVELSPIPPLRIASPALPLTVLAGLGLLIFAGIASFLWRIFRSSVISRSTLLLEIRVRSRVRWRGARYLTASIRTQLIPPSYLNRRHAVLILVTVAVSIWLGLEVSLFLIFFVAFVLACFWLTMLSFLTSWSAAESSTVVDTSDLIVSTSGFSNGRFPSAQVPADRLPIESRFGPSVTRVLRNTQHWSKTGPQTILAVVDGSVSRIPWEASIEELWHAKYPPRIRRVLPEARIRPAPPLEHGLVVSWVGTPEQDDMAVKGWRRLTGYSRFRHVVTGLSRGTTTPKPQAHEVRLLHVVGSPLQAASGVRLEVAALAAEGLDRVRELLRPDELADRFPELALCILQAPPVQLKDTVAADREQAADLRWFASELFALGVPAVITIPALPASIGVVVLEQLADVIGPPRNRADTIIDSAQRAREAIQGMRVGMSQDAQMAASLDLCVYATDA
jgi:hypothetical protein